ncbi:MAG TPA: chemotaxis response regulator protein-glutamate methylesterase [Xanthomonadales bacterium]|nr:chemotaxis response regulator protein-glutamate methylesterase [Xanthomonadales bacterium]
MTIKVLVIDDSALVRQVLTELLSADPDIEVVGSAADPIVARDKIKTLAPDVLTLDVEMPRMDGLTFLENLMRLRPMPVVMVSSLTERGAEVTLEALALGAVDFVAKPKLDVARGLADYADELREKVRAAARARVGAAPAQRLPEQPKTAVPPQRRFRTTDRLIAIGASTGGTEAIREVLEAMPPDAPAIVIVQHIPPGFSAAFAQRMNRCSAMAVFEARDGQPILPGHVYIAPGDRHLRVVGDGAKWLCRLDDGPQINRHRPSVDVLFRSVLTHAGRNAVAAVLTGMGDDGARGLLELREAGVHTVVQDEASSVVWGMPGSAVKLGAAEEILPLAQIAPRLLALSN